MMKLLTTLLAFPLICAAQGDHAAEAKNPFAGDAKAIAAGKRLYNQACLACHGAEGRGDRGPSLVSGNLTHGNADGEIFTVIRSGVRGSQMPAFSSFTSEQTWQIIAFVRTLGPAAPSPNDGGGMSAGSVSGDAVAGKSLVNGKGNCLACHMINGAGKSIGPDLSMAAQIPDGQLKAKLTSPTPGAGGRGRRGQQPPSTVTARTRDGHVYRGVEKGLDALSVQMIDTDGKYHSFEKAALADLKIEAKSIMPANLSGPEIDHVVAYLKTLNSSANLGAGLTWERIRDSAKEPQNYLSYWGDLGGKHYSTLNQINALNVKNLQAKWAVQMPGDGIVESIPLVIDGIMYTTGPVGGSAEVRALDAKTGHTLWRYTRKQKVVNPYEINRVNRGVTVFGNRLFFGTLDAYLVALDARTGAFLWEKQFGDTMLGYNITSPPLVVKDKIITGITGGEFGAECFLWALDPATGNEIWKWKTIPGPGEFGHDTWEGDSWKHGAAPTWLTGQYDAELDTVYWAIGNPGPDINGDVRKGDNLFSCSVVAIDPNTGKRKWHYQFTPNDTHDWDSTEDMVLVDRMWHGQMRKLILHADRNGAFYVIDRATGKFLAAAPFVRATWVKGWDADGRPITTEGWRASPEGATVYPWLGGGSNFQAPSYSPITGWLYFAYYDGPGFYSIGPAPFEPGKQFQGTGGGRAKEDPGQAPPSQGVMAFDPETMKVVWKFETTQLSLSSGVLATAGNVVFAATPEGNFLALDAKTGKALWNFAAGAALPSSPISYSVDGKQYVAVSSNNVLYAFALPN